MILKNEMVRISAIFSLVFLLLTPSCSDTQEHGADISNDPAVIASGRGLFMQDCSACHHFHQDAIGPKLGGVTREVDKHWLKRFISNAQEVIASGDPRAQQLFEKYKVVMPSFSMYSDEQLERILAFLHTQEASETAAPVPDSLQVLLNPIPEPIPTSDLVVEVKEVAQIPPSSDQMPRTRIAKMDHMPETGRLFVSDLRGKLYELQDGQAVAFMDFQELKPNFIHTPGLATGFGSFAFHPECNSNKKLYTTHTEAPASARADFAFADSVNVTLQWVLTEWMINDAFKGVDPASARELIRINMVSGIHGVQEITFHPGARPGDEDYGLLFVSVGDGGCVINGYPEIAMGPSRVWGSILRIDPLGSNSRNGAYGIPPSNPFVKEGEDKGVPEIYAHGFRNPHRITWDHTGRMLATGIGQHRVEEVNLILPGQNYGWPIAEGTFQILTEVNMSEVYPLPDAEMFQTLTYPVIQYDHDEGNAISGGFEYLGNEMTVLQGKYFFGDIVRGRLFYTDLDDIVLGAQAPIYEWNVSFDGNPTTLMDLCGNARVDLRFGRDAEGDLYLFTKADGKIYRLVGAEPM